MKHSEIEIFKLFISLEFDQVLVDVGDDSTQRNDREETKRHTGISNSIQRVRAISQGFIYI